MRNVKSSAYTNFFFFFFNVGPPKEDIFSGHLLSPVFQSIFTHYPLSPQPPPFIQSNCIEPFFGPKRDSIHRDKSETSYEADALPPNHHGWIPILILKRNFNLKIFIFRPPYVFLKTTVLDKKKVIMQHSYKK